MLHQRQWYNSLLLNGIPSEPLLSVHEGFQYNFTALL